MALGCFAAATLAAEATGAAAAKLMDWPDLLGRPMPAATEKIAYGPGPLQFGELWLPAGAGPFPVVLMVHGGCWLSGVAKLSIMNYAAEDLRRRGVAVWNIEYRGVDRPGGGYPGTFEDVAAGADALQRIAPAHRLRLGRVVALGHSAGGHLVMWLAARGRIPAASVLRADHPLAIAGVVSAGGLPDLEPEAAEDVCGAGVIGRLVGPPSAAHPNVYVDTSPAELGLGPEPQVQINGEEDGIAPPAFARAYAARMQNPRLSTIVLPETGHVELIAPGAAAWDKVVERVNALIR
ncbi:MAG TPA: alpha/beta hydrolase [Caulobacteraceae bacterium]